MDLIDSKKVAYEEKERKDEYKKKVREENTKLAEEKAYAKNMELTKRMGRVVQKVGKPLMPRSMKKRIKKDVVEVKVDEDTIDYVRYLGEDMA